MLSDRVWFQWIHSQLRNFALQLAETHIYGQTNSSIWLEYVPVDSLRSIYAKTIALTVIATNLYFPANIF